MVSALFAACPRPQAPIQNAANGPSTLVAKTAPQRGIPAEAIGLRKTSVFAESPTLPTGKYPDADPGDGKRLPRAFVGAPPAVPHSFEWKTGETLAANECLECHLDGSDDAPRVSVFHRTEAKMLRSKSGKNTGGQVYAVAGKIQVKTVSGWFHDCRICHAPRIGNLKPLVKNTFGSR